MFYFIPEWIKWWNKRRELEEEKEEEEKTIPFGVS
jgi:hypothetical protein